MAPRNKLKGVDVRRVAALANRGGQKAAADAFGVSQAAISNLLRDNGYTPRIVYVRADEAEQPTAQPESEGTVING